MTLFAARHRPALAATAGVAALTALTGCATTVAAVPTAAPATAGAAPAVAVSHTPAPPTSNAPTLATTGTNWSKVVGSLLTYGQWLLANPDPALAANVAEPGCASTNALTADLRSLVQQDAYLQPSPPTVTSVTGPATGAGAQVTLDITAVRAAEPVYVRTAGTAQAAVRVLSTKAQMPATDLQLTLVLGGDKRWRLCTVVDTMNDPDGDAVTTLL